jgi:rRNA processing protein Gar1
MTGTIGTIHSGRQGDTVVVAPHRAEQSERVGEILEVLGEPDHVHYRVRWEAGNESVLYPSSDATIRPARGRSSTRTST